jgi:hypothetical protein
MGFVVDKAAFSMSTSLFPAKHSTECSIIIWGWYNRPVMTSVIVNSVPLHPIKKKRRYSFSYWF